VKRSALLQPQQSDLTYRVAMTLQQGRRCEFLYSDRQLARDHFEVLRAVGVIGTWAIKEITFHEHT